jgi:hypothetical protein
MKKNNKSTPFLMILVLSIIATQLSLKSFGVNVTPSLGTIIQSWGKVAGVIGHIYHPGLVAQLDTLSIHFLNSDGKAPLETEKPCGELACNPGKDFDFELPPPIDVNDPSVTIDEPAKECFVKVISRSIVKRESPGLKELDVEVLEIAADADAESAATEAKPEAIVESLRSIAVGITADEPEVENNAFAPLLENKAIVSEEEAQATPKPEKHKKPCSELEKLRKLDETVKLMYEYKFEPELQLVNQAKPNFDMDAFQALQAFRFLDRAKRVRVVIRPQPLTLPRSSVKETFNLLTVAEESEF